MWHLKRNKKTEQFRTENVTDIFLTWRRWEMCISFIRDHLGELVTDGRELIKIYRKGVRWVCIYTTHFCQNNDIHLPEPTPVTQYTFSMAQIMGTVLYKCGTVKYQLPKTFRKSMQVNTFRLGCKILGLTIPHEATILFIFFLEIWIHDVQNFRTVYCCQPLKHIQHICYITNTLQIIRSIVLNTVCLCVWVGSDTGQHQWLYVPG